MYVFNVFNKLVEIGKVKIKFSKNFVFFYILGIYKSVFFLIVK